MSRASNSSYCRVLGRAKRSDVVRAAEAACGAKENR
jgi:hypothetical protein